MVSQTQSFDVSGPIYLTAIDWRNPHHRRSVAASLVQGVYSLEHDRQHKREWHQSLARLWWEFFDFECVRMLVDSADQSIFGAIYKFKSPPPYYGHHYPHQSPPRYVVAFRGTMTGSVTWLQDLKSDLGIIRNTLEQSPRFQVAMQAVQNTVSIAGAANMWLAGHSLGSAMAMLAGKNMAKNRCFLETYLFNPPIIATPVELTTKTEILKHGIRLMRSAVTAGVAVAVHDSHHRDWFALLAEWNPYLFVNPSDPISAEYVEYFEQRNWMVEIGAGAIGRVATRNSISGAYEPVHLIPSAYLTTNLSPTKKAHGLEQWWKPNIQCQFKLHQYFR